MAKGKIVLQGSIELLSPSCIGSGKKDYTEIDVLLDGDGRPFIPATSLVGVLNHYIKLDGHDDDLKRFWGFISRKGEEISEDEKEQQSSLCCSDLYCFGGDPKIAVRDGIKIDNKNGIVISGKKYDYQVVERGTRFNLHLEVNLEARFTDATRQFFRRMVATIRSVLEQGLVQIGAKTNSGLGKMQLSNARVCEFDFKEKGVVFRWLRRDFSVPTPFPEQPFEIKTDNFSIHAVFTLKGSFISRSYSADPNSPDAVSIKSGDAFVIPGTSLKGAIRSRAERILKTFGKSQNVLLKLFGDVNEETKEKSKGKISIDEVILPGYANELQTRIKIDRFTGGAIESALFETMPLFSDNDENKLIKNVNIAIKDYKDHEVGLILLVLKDLWTGDLAVGKEKNIGKNVFKGIQADITWNDEKVTLKKDLRAF